MYTYTHTHTHTHAMHTHTHTHTHAHIHTRTHSHMLTHIVGRSLFYHSATLHICTAHTWTHTYTHTYTHTCTISAHKQKWREPSTGTWLEGVQGSIDLAFG